MKNNIEIKRPTENESLNSWELTNGKQTLLISPEGAGHFSLWKKFPYVKPIVNGFGEHLRFSSEEVAIDFARKVLNGEISGLIDLS